MIKQAISKKMATALLVVTTAAAVPVVVQAGGMGAEYFKKADINNDGALTKEEIAASRMKHLGNADTNKDGFVSATELTEHHAAMMRSNQDKHFSKFSERFDTNKDGKVAVDEIKTHEPAFFKKADANGDGKLTQDEMKAARGKHHGMMDDGERSMMDGGPGTVDSDDEGENANTRSN